MRIKQMLVVVIGLMCCTLQANAAQLRTYVAEFKVTGTSGKDELRNALQAMLASRLSGDRITVVETAQQAEVTISGSYVAFGKVFSLDAVAKDVTGRVICRSFEQGDTQDLGGRKYLLNVVDVLGHDVDASVLALCILG